MGKSLLNNQKSSSSKGGCNNCCNSKSILNKPDCDNNKVNSTQPGIQSTTNNKLPQITNTNKTNKNSP